MHIDLAHAAGSAILIFLTVWGLRKTGIVSQPVKGRFHWDWKIFFAIFIVIFIFNMIWPSH